MTKTKLLKELKNTVPVYVFCHVSKDDGEYFAVGRTYFAKYVKECPSDMVFDAVVRAGAIYIG